MLQWQEHFFSVSYTDYFKGVILLAPCDVAAYAAPKDLLHKSVEELVELKEAGLKVLYYGMESGDDITLKAVKKGVDGPEAREAGRRATAAGSHSYFSMHDDVGVNELFINVVFR